MVCKKFTYVFPALLIKTIIYAKFIKTIIHASHDHYTFRPGRRSARDIEDIQ
jgi:hypothetical protein